MVLATRFASSSVRQPSTSMTTRCSAPSASDAMPAPDRHRSPGRRLQTALDRTGDRRAGAIGKDQDCVVRARMAFDADAIERAFHRMAQDRLQVRRSHRCVGQQEPEHGRHVGANHGGALGEPGDRVRADLSRRRLGSRSVVKIACVVVIKLTLVAAKLFCSDRDTSFEHAHRQQPADHPGGCDENLLRSTANSVGGQLGHSPCVCHPLCAGASVRVAGTDDEAAGVVRGSRSLQR